MASMATLATPLKSAEEAHHSAVVKCVMDQQSNALYFSRSFIPSNKKHHFNPRAPIYRHIGLYVYRPNFFFSIYLWNLLLCS